MLRRRNEILQDFLTPDEPELEKEFFRVKRAPQEEEPEEPPVAEESSETAEMQNDSAIQWGTAPE